MPAFYDRELDELQQSFERTHRKHMRDRATQRMLFGLALIAFSTSCLAFITRTWDGDLVDWSTTAVQVLCIAYQVYLAHDAWRVRKAHS